MENNGQTKKKIYRSGSDKMIFGVCGGLGKYFDIDSLIFRIIFLLLLFGGGFGVLLYIILAIIIPPEPVSGTDNPGTLNKEEFKDRVNELASEIKEHNSGSVRNFFGLLIVVLGAFLLLGNLFPRFIRWDLFWPLALILVGLLIISRRK